ncbi:MAG: TonB-dependent receptor [Bryobacterales bacterium]|nr:TonB-dependent receptor [Bryobacterales bacterium]
MRNNKFDARPFFSSRTSPLKRNQFGGSTGGPIKRDKLFFFGNYEGFREAATGNPPVGRVMDENERNGTFTGAIRDPFAGGAAFPNNTIPRNRIDPISLRILDLVPMPNNPDPARNFIFNDVPSGRTNRDYAIGRVDYNMSEKDIVYGRYLYNEEEFRSPPTLPAPALSNGRRTTLRAQTASAHWNRVISPSLINNLNLGYTRYANQVAGLNAFVRDFVTPSGITNTLSATDPLFWGTPNVSVPGYLFTGEVTGNFRTMNTYQIQESLLWNRGKHTIKAGADLREIRTWMFYTGGNGSTSFANRYSGQTGSDFLLGYASNTTKTARATQWNSKIHYGGFFIQDDWKVTPTLTLNLGLRYEVESALRQVDNGGLGFDVGAGTMLISRLATNLAAIEDFYTNVRPDVPIRIEDRRAPYNADINNLAPRAGFAWSFRPRWVMRGGYGIYYDSPQIQSLASTNDFAPNTLRPIWTGAPPTQLPDLGYNPEGNVAPEETLRRAPLTIFPFLSRNFPYGKIQQWNLNMQYQVSNTLMTEVMYQGSNGVNLLGFDNINFREPGPGNVQQTLRFPQFARIQAEDMWGRSFFHGLGVKVEQRPVHGFMYLIAYTFSRSIDLASTLNQGPQWVDPFNRNTARGPSDFNAPHRFSAAYEYRLPIGRGRPFASDVQGAADKLISGWGVRGMTFFQTGLPQNVSMALSRNATCAVACAARPDRIGDGNLSKDERTLQRFYDVSAFRLIAPGGADRRVGNAGRNILTSAGLAQFDLQVFKDTRIREGHSLEFRWEMFNAFNHTNWGGAGTNMEAPQLFGVISSTRAPRIMQFALRYQF